MPLGQHMNLEIVWDGGEIKFRIMKVYFEWFSVIFSSLGIFYSLYLLYLEMRSVGFKENKDRFFLLNLVRFYYLTHGYHINLVWTMV